jgi:hypothetical protein
MADAIPVSVNYEALQIAVRKEIIDTYQHGSLLGLFPSEPIPKGIAAEEWGLRYIKEQQRAALHKRGYQPNQVSMDYSGFKLFPVTVDQEARLGEIELSQFAENGLLPKFVPEIGKNMSYTVNSYIMANLGGAQEAAPYATQYHYVLEAGTGNGTAERPIPMYDASGGAWDTHATMRGDIGSWLGGYQAKGGNLSQSLVLAPRATAPTLKTIKSEYNDHNVEYYIKEMGVRDIVYIDDEFFPTIVDGTTLATKDLFDLVVINPSEFVVGYQRPERVRAGLVPWPSRDYLIEAEVWFAFLCVPYRRNEGGTMKTYKHMGRCKDITTS